MHDYRIKPSKLQGAITVPPSKSQTLRAILFATLAKGKSTILHYLPSPDSLTMIDACRSFGAHIDITQNTLDITGINSHVTHTKDVIHAGNSGIVLRFCSAIGALAKHPVVITGDHSIRYQRPMKPLLDGLQQLGVSAVSMRGDGYAPVIIQGPIKSGATTIHGADSQPVSSLLIAASLAEGPVELCVKQAGELPWIDLTLDWLHRLGIPFNREGYSRYSLKGNATFDGFEYHVPGDMSSAAFPIAAALVTQSTITVKNVDMKDPQGDKELIHVFQRMGASIDIHEDEKIVQVKQSGSLKGIEIDINNFIDGITILAVVACFAEGETHIYNGAIAKQKECNRIKSIATELRKMGAHIEETEDGLKIQKSNLHGADLHSYHDHRMAMSLSVAALGAKGDSKIHAVECIAKTYPSFARDFAELGAEIEVVK